MGRSKHSATDSGWRDASWSVKDHNKMVHTRGDGTKIRIDKDGKVGFTKGKAKKDKK